MLQPYFSKPVGKGVCFQSLQRFIRRSAKRRTPVLLIGESGTGKEMVARAIHFASRRKSHPFLMVDCSLYYERELERELFGIAGTQRQGSHKKGLLEFSSAGTCYLSNAEELSPTLQERIFNYLETGYLQRVGSKQPVASRVRLILSSSKDLVAFAEGGLFSGELLSHGSKFLLEIPPLRDHAEDIEPFTREFACRYSVGDGTGSTGKIEFCTDAWDAFLAYPWPGNYDELKNELVRLFRSGVTRVTPNVLNPEIAHYWLGRRGSPQVRRCVEELENCIQEFRLMARLDSEYGEVLLNTDSWDLDLKCYDRIH